MTNYWNGSIPEKGIEIICTNPRPEGHDRGYRYFYEFPPGYKDKNGKNYFSRCPKCGYINAVWTTCCNSSCNERFLHIFPPEDVVYGIIGGGGVQTFYFNCPMPNCRKLNCVVIQ